MDGGQLGSGFRIVPYRPEHLQQIALQPHQEHLAAFLARGDFARNISVAGPAWTAVVDGQPIACGGLEERWVGRSICWAVLSDAAGQHMTALTRAVRRGLAEHPAERIEATVRVGFEPGMRWVKMLGFEDEGLLRRYHYGQDHRAFVLLKNTP